MQQRHPLLRVRIAVNAIGHPWFVEDRNIEKIPLRHVQRQGEQHWQQEVEYELSQPLRASRSPLIRAVLVHAPCVSEIILTCHHAIADGISSTYLIRDILRTLSNPESQLCALPIPLSLEENLPMGILDKFRKNLTHDHNTSFIDSDESEDKPHNFEDYICTSACSLSKEMTAQLISRCRHEQTSVHCAICASFLLTINAQDRTKPTASLLICGTAVDLRRYLKKVDIRDVGVYSFALISSHMIGKRTNFWDLARSLKYQLNEKMTKEKIYGNFFDLHQKMSEYPEPTQCLLDLTKTKADIVVSNLKCIAIPQEWGKFKLKTIYGPMLVPYSKGAPAIGIATLGGQLSLTCTSQNSQFLTNKNFLMESKRLLDTVLVTK